MTELRDLDEKLDTVIQGMAAMRPKVDRADKEIFGNGQPGLAKQVEKVQSQVGMLLKLGAALGGASLTTLLGILAALLLGG